MRKSTFLYFILFLLFLQTNIYAKEVYFIDNATLELAEKNHGEKARQRMISLVKLLNTIQNKTELEKLKYINDFFNAITYSSDLKVWNKKDYWATREEFLSIDQGDCEDYVIAKYFSLRQLGLSNEKIFLTYVKAIKYRQSHMILTYYENKNSIPLILDNIVQTILPASKRKDLLPLFNFNGEKIYMAKQRGLGRVVPKGKINLKQWSNLILKIKREKT
ncbi:transglutaminase-like cysteine peptidase [Sulfurimonas sp. SAG-AH-194-C21]|nr:transglutaminase-like cysteine peptidase [Sulfurimonas sp. SAG-AH-194-C21]MDF1884522.1 transglutaminase-like cysteine peptidase [Sulfurimonas sp. SAG-AH-194-C21]